MQAVPLPEDGRGYKSKHKEVMMRINKSVYPDLISIHSSLNVTPYYVSGHFINECRRNESKFNEDANSMEGLFLTNCFSKIAGRRFIYLIKGGIIIYGIHGGWHAFADKRGPLMRVTRDEAAWRIYPESNVNVPNDGQAMKVICDTLIKTTRLIGLFTEFSEVTAKVLPPKGKIKMFHCRYKSDFGFNVRLLTENWYTESCQNHPFVVRGHWRWQAHGERLMQRKLIWIDTYMKDGYTKGAYINQEK